VFPPFRFADAHTDRTSWQSVVKSPLPAGPEVHTDVVNTAWCSLHCHRAFTRLGRISRNGVGDERRWHADEHYRPRNANSWLQAHPSICRICRACYARRKVL